MMIWMLLLFHFELVLVFFAHTASTTYYAATAFIFFLFLFCSCQRDSRHDKFREASLCRLFRSVAITTSVEASEMRTCCLICFFCSFCCRVFVSFDVCLSTDFIVMSFLLVVSKMTAESRYFFLKLSLVQHLVVYIYLAPFLSLFLFRQ